MSTKVGKGQSSYNPNNYSIPINYLRTIKPIPNTYDIKKINNVNYALSAVGIGNTGVKFVLITPLSEYYKEINLIKLIIIITALVCLLLSAYLNKRFTKRITSPIDELYYNMKKVQEGDFSAQSGIVDIYEMGQMQQMFNHMVNKIKELVDKVYEEEKKKRSAELNALQAQINPHFLYNTLNSLNCIAKLHKEEEISKIIVSLSDLLRISINKESEFITIADEIEYIKKYLVIQNIRFRDKFFAEFDIEPELLDKKILKLTLQPLVENSIYHGLENLEVIGIITISIKRQNSDIDILITDNGIGMDEKEIIILNKTLLVNEDDNNSSIGVRNVNSRIKLHFGDNYGLQFVQNHNSGVRVFIKIPIIDN